MAFQKFQKFQNNQAPRSTYDRPRQITGIMQFGESAPNPTTGARRKIAALKIHGENPVYGVGLNKNDEARAVTRPELNIPCTTPDGQVLQHGVVFKIDNKQGKLRDPNTKDLIGTFKAKQTRGGLKFHDVEFNEKGQNIFKSKIVCIRQYETGPNGGFKIVNSRGNTVGEMTGPFDNGLVHIDINGAKATADIESSGRHGFKYRVLFDSNDEIKHPNRTAYPTGPILVEVVGNKLMHVARVFHSTSKNGKDMMKIVFNGKDGAKPQDAYVFFKDDSNDNSIVRFVENKLIEFGKFNGNKNSQQVEIELDGKKYTYVSPIGNIMFDNQQTSRPRQPSNPTPMAYDPENNPLKLSDLTTHYIKADKRRERDWTNLVGNDSAPQAVLAPKVDETEEKTEENQAPTQTVSAPVKKRRI